VVFYCQKNIFYLKGSNQKNSPCENDKEKKQLIEKNYNSSCEKDKKKESIRTFQMKDIYLAVKKHLNKEYYEWLLSVSIFHVRTHCRHFCKRQIITWCLPDKKTD